MNYVGKKFVIERIIVILNLLTITVEFTLLGED